MLGGFLGTNLGHYGYILGVEGWRVAFHVVAIVSFVLAALLICLASDPRQNVRHAHLQQPPNYVVMPRL